MDSIIISEIRGNKTCRSIFGSDIFEPTGRNSPTVPDKQKEFISAARE